MSLLMRKFMVPPYCGLPRLSHQFPAAAVDGVETLVVDVLEDTVAEAVCEVICVVAVLFVVVWLVVEVLHDASSIDATRRQVSAIQMTPFFI
jgi:hypothetical protein